MTKEKKHQYIEKKLKDFTGSSPTKFVIVSDDEVNTYLVTISTDLSGVENYRKDSAESLYSTIFLSREVLGVDYVSMGDEELTDSILHTLYEKREDPDWLILPLGCEIPPVSWGNPQLYLWGNPVWWDDEEYVSLRRGVCGFIATYRKKWEEKTKLPKERWNREKVREILADELRVHNQYLLGEALMVCVQQWKPAQCPEMPDDLEHTHYEDLEFGYVGGFPVDDLAEVYDHISEVVGTEKWRDYDPERDRLAYLTKKFVIKSYDCPICGAKEGITGYVYPTSFSGTCWRCGTVLKTTKPYYKND